MNQFLSILKTLLLYGVIVFDTLKYWLLKIYYALFSVLSIKYKDSDTLLGNKLLYLKYLVIKFLLSVYSIFKVPAVYRFISSCLNNKSLNEKNTYHLKIHNSYGVVKTILYDSKITDIIKIRDTIGEKKTDGCYGKKLISKVFLLQGFKITDITERIKNFASDNNILTLRDVLLFENIIYYESDLIKFEYVDFECLASNPTTTKTDRLVKYLRKDIYSLLD